MDREQAIQIFRDKIDWANQNRYPYINESDVEAYKMAIEALAISSAEPQTEQFAKWVASEIFDEMWEYNKDSFAEIACRKLAKLGIVRAKGDEWELVEEQESEDKE